MEEELYGVKENDVNDFNKHDNDREDDVEAKEGEEEQSNGSQSVDKA